MAGLDVSFDHHLLSLRGAAAADVLGPGYWDVGLLYGRTLRWRRGAAGASVGLALMGGDDSGGLGAPAPVGTRLSLPVAVRAAWFPFPVVGFGAYAFANVNDARPFAGVSLTIEVGRLR